MIFKILLTAFSMLMVVFSTANAQTQAVPADSATTLVGKWTGSYDGASSGKFELVINQNDSPKLTGLITMLLPEGSGKPITLKTVTYQDGQVVAAYDDPENGEVNLTGKLSNPTLKGTWQLANGQATGNWQLTRAGR